MALTLQTNKKYTALYSYSDGTPYINAGWSASVGQNSSIQTSLIRETGSNYIAQVGNIATCLTIKRTNDDATLALAGAKFRAFRYSTTKNGAFPDSFFDSDNDTEPKMPSGYTDISSQLQVSKTGNVIEITLPKLTSTSYGVVIPISLGMLNALIKQPVTYGYTMRNDIANCTLQGEGCADGEYSGIAVLPTLNPILTANEGYEFTSGNVPYLSYIDGNGDEQCTQFTIIGTGSGNSAICEFTPSDGKTYSIVANATEYVDVEYSYEVEANISNAVLSGINIGTTVQHESLTQITVRVDANDGYEFTNTNIPTIGYIDGEGNTINQPFTIETTSDGKTAILEFVPIADVHYTITAIAANVDENERYSGLVTIYNVTKEQLTEIANTRYYHTETLPKVETVDLADYITNIWEYPFTVIGNKTQKMVLGGYEVPITTTVITNPNVKIKFKPVMLPVLAGDYDCRIWIPFSGFHTLNYDYIKGNEISIIYDIDMYNARAMVSILNNNDLIEEYECTVARTLPYKTYQNNITTDRQGTYSGSAMLINNLIPFIIVTQNNTNQFKFVMTKDEYDELTKLLKEGIVYG